MSSPFMQLFQNPAIQPYLPFFFTLAVVYGLLSITGEKDEGLFGKSSVNLIISLVFAFFAAGYEPFVNFFFNYFGFILWAFIGLFFLAFFRKAITAGEETDHKDKIIIVGILFLMALSLGGFGMGYMTGVEIPILGSENFVVLVGLFLAIFLFYNAYKMEKGD
ncbi:MAG: hypothetical protein ACLFQ8_01360 [Candidatus Aenigmatarchaeota archaeon]